MEQANSRAFALRQQGRLVEAVREYSRALEVEPGHFKSLFNRGFTYDRVGGRAGGRAGVAWGKLGRGGHESAGLDEEKPGRLGRSRRVRIACKDLEPKVAYGGSSAVPEIDAVVTMSPSCVPPCPPRLQLGELVAAVEDYTAALAAEPHSSYAHYNRGITRDRLQVRPRVRVWACACRRRGRCAYHTCDCQTGQRADALLWLPGWRPLKGRNACVHAVRTQDYAGAVEDFSAAIALEPGNADFYHNRGFALRKQVCGRAGRRAGRQGLATTSKGEAATQQRNAK